MPNVPQTTRTSEPTKTEVSVVAPSDEARKIVGAVVQRAIETDRDARESGVPYEERVLLTPGVLEAFDIAVAELDSLKRTL
jgi:hypothetical protein